MHQPADCEGCGKCCQKMGLPPFLEYELDSLPEDLRNELELVKIIDPERDEGGQPCIWLDLDTKRCINYKHRPFVCEEFQVGCESCLLYRSFFK